MICISKQSGWCDSFCFKFSLSLGVAFHGIALLLCQCLRDNDLERHVVVALLVVVGRELLDAVVWYLLSLIVLCSRRQLNRYIAIQRFNSNFSSEDCLTNVQEEVSVYIRSFSLKICVGLHLYIYYQVSRWATLTSMTLLRDSQVHSIIDAFRNIDRFFYLFMRSSSASTGQTINHKSCKAV